MISRRDSCPERLKYDEQQLLVELPPGRKVYKPSANMQPDPASQSAPVSPTSYTLTRGNVQHVVFKELSIEEEQAIVLQYYPCLAPGWQPIGSSSIAPMSPGSYKQTLLDLQHLLHDDSSDDSSSEEESCECLPITPMADGIKAILYDPTWQQEAEAVVSAANQCLKNRALLCWVDQATLALLQRLDGERDKIAMISALQLLAQT
jgi:hypothetical protein